MKELKRSQKIVTQSLFVLYLVVMTWIIVFKMTVSVQDLPNFRGLNLIPFGDSAVINNQMDLSEIIYNVLIFIPFGVYISMLKPHWTFIKKIVSIAGVSLSFEVIQYIFSLGGTDITDLIGNTLGGAIGISLYFVLHKIFDTKTTKVLNVLALMGTVFVVGLLGLLVFVNH